VAPAGLDPIVVTVSEVFGNAQSVRPANQTDRAGRGARPMLHMKDVSKVFRTATVETHALRSLTLEVGAGEFVAVTGPSGSGKTTFLNIAGLLEELTGGTYQLDGVDVATLDDRARSGLRNEKIGFVFQSFNLIPDLDLFDNVDVPLRYRGLSRGERRKRVEAALERVGLGMRTRHYPAELSGGQQQRVAIARAIAGDPKLVLADEPTGNLDSQMASEVLQLLVDLNAQGTVLVIVTHDPAIAGRAPRNVHIVDGIVTDVVREPAPASSPPAAVSPAV
jgi:putative ABC transport system ATP-binding protein